MGRTKTKPFLKRKKVPKLYFHFWPPKKCHPFFFLIHTWWCENITASPCDWKCVQSISIKAKMNGVFKILQYSEMECNCVRKITEGVFRKYSTLWQHKCESPMTVLKILCILGPRLQPIELIGKSGTGCCTKCHYST